MLRKRSAGTGLTPWRSSSKSFCISFFIFPSYVPLPTSSNSSSGFCNAVKGFGVLKERVPLSCRPLRDYFLTVISWNCCAVETVGRVVNPVCMGSTTRAVVVASLLLPAFKFPRWGIPVKKSHDVLNFNSICGFYVSLEVLQTTKACFHICKLLCITAPIPCYNVNMGLLYFSLDICHLSSCFLILFICHVDDRVIQAVNCEYDVASVC